MKSAVIQLALLTSIVMQLGLLDMNVLVIGLHVILKAIRWRAVLVLLDVVGFIDA